jgi:phosphate transport system substrate-binding protein
MAYRDRMRSQALAGLTLLVAVGGCRGDHRADGHTISVKGSDTLVQVATGWAQTYSARPGLSRVSASGGGSGVGIAGLIDGTVDIATSSREMKPKERSELTARRGLEVHEHFIGSDALAIFVHPSNPLEAISLTQLGELWAENGTVTDWSQVAPGMKGPLVLIGRQNSSGTYDYFREVVCAKGADGKAREFRGGVSELSGSSEVLEKIAGAPLALGYSGMGYRTPQVKWLAVSRTDGAPAEHPTVDGARSGSYPIARKLYLYTAGTPSPEVQAFLEWVVSDEGQQIVAREGYVPVR